MVAQQVEDAVIAAVAGAAHSHRAAGAAVILGAGATLVFVDAVDIEGGRAVDGPFDAVAVGVVDKGGTRC